MPDKFKINEKLGLMEIYSYGIVTAEDIDQSIEKAQDASKKFGLNKLSLQSPIFKDLYLFFSFLNKLLFPYQKNFSDYQNRCYIRQ